MSSYSPSSDSSHVSPSSDVSHVSPSSGAYLVCSPSFYNPSSVMCEVYCPSYRGSADTSQFYIPPYYFSPCSDAYEIRAKESILSNRPSYAMVASGCRPGGSLLKRYRQGASSSSSSHKTCEGDKTYIAIFYPSGMFHLLLFRVSLHSLLLNLRNNMSSLSLDNNHPYDLKKHYTTMSCLHPSQLTKDFIDLLPAGSPRVGSMCATCTSSVGGLGPCLFLFNSRYNSKEVFRYNLHQPDMSIHRCANMKAAAVNNSLYVQIGDFLYVLSYAGGNQPVVQKYDIQKDIWTLVKDNIITRCDYTHHYNLSMISVPRVVINGKLHISFGYNNFAFDTEMDTWEYSNLFDTFWSKHNPFDFHGQQSWGMIEKANWKFANRSFGFYGRGIVWDEDILLGVLYSPKCQLVAFQLIDNKVVNSQPFTFTDHDFNGAQLVDLGQGYFGLLHVTKSRFYTHHDSCDELELVTILVSKPPKPRADCFLECRIVRKDIVAENLTYSAAMNASKAVSV